jgi:SNF2 family DNA or RNA helicase
MGESNGFKPVYPVSFNPLNPHGSRQTVIIPDPALKARNADEGEDDDDFDPDAVIRAEGNQFGAPDPYAYVESDKAHQNIKALLESAFAEDDETLPRTRLRRKAKKQQQAAATTLAEKLAALDVEDEEKASKENEDEEEPEEDGSVEGMNVKLLPHQVDGVTWMIEKETGAHMKSAPPKAGILADDMGLGKTIQSIALILTNPRPEKDAKPENAKNKILPTVGKGTLIVAPLALIRQWDAEIKDKVTKSNSLKVLVHHGPNRTKSAEKLKQYDVVVTTYQILSSEHASCGDGPDGLKKGCFGVHWYRIILDEAHTIKNRNAKMTKACYDLRSHYRWCLTGTPMQNNLDELQSLIHFLRIKPLCDMTAWKDRISGPMKNGRGNLAMRRLQVCLKGFMKRRTKDILKKDGALNFGSNGKNGDEKPAFQIVGRNIETVVGSFTVQERAFYDRLANRAASRLAEMMGSEKTDYIGALVLLLRLRQACNHPKLTKSNVRDDKDALTTGSKTNTQSGIQTPRKVKDADADDLADLLGGLSVATKRCDICQAALSKNNAAAGAIRCNECEDDLMASQKKTKKHKKHKKHRKHKHKKERQPESDAEDDEEDKPEASKSSRQRRVVVDSDDENEQSGEWLVPEDQRDSPRLGKAGGTDDEDAEGGGDTLDSIDSVSFATEDEGTPTKKGNDSFIVHDTDSEDEAPVVRNRHLQKKQVIDLLSDDDSDSRIESDAEQTDSETGSDESDTGESDLEYHASDLTPSTKIRQLLSILEKETPDHKVIVFSQFTSMLDLIEPFLEREGYDFTRYDGSMRNDLREASLYRLRNDKRTRVLLCSLKCGSLGLNLTAASRVVIMEPFWNPVSTYMAHSLSFVY